MDTRRFKLFILSLFLPFFCMHCFSEPVMTDVFVGGLEDYPEYRIPAMVTTQKGTLLAFAEGRQTLSDHAENKIVLKRSEDDGQTWQPLQVVAENGRHSLNNPQAVVLPETGRILLMYQDFSQNYHSRAIGKKIQRAMPGHSGEGVQTTFLVYSDDDGETWSKPRDITPGVKRPEVISAIASGPGRGIVLAQRPYAGRIVMPFNESWYEGKERKFHVYSAYSDDGGQTWDYGWPAPHDQDKPGQNGWGNEVQMVELVDGTIMLNSRGYKSEKYRKNAFSKDGGQTWSYLEDDIQLPEPQCMGSIIRFCWPSSGKKGVLAYSGPGTMEGRHTGTVRLSFDDGKTWPASKVLEPDYFSYSCLTVLKDGRIGCLYEVDKCKKTRFAAFPAGWIAPELKPIPGEPEVFDIFVTGKEKVEGENGRDYAQYREQNIVVTNSGKIVCVTQGRNASNWSDRSGQDLVVKTSNDHGKTWSDDTLVVTHGLKSVCPNAAVYDADTNRIHVMYNLFMWDYTNVPKDVRGEMGDIHCKQYEVTSDDEGRSWSKPRDITDMIETHGAVMVVGSGEGIQLKQGKHKGRLIIAGGDFHQNKKVLCFYSDDHGKTWQRSNVVPWEGKVSWASESKVAELPDGTVVLNSRTFVRDGSKQRLRTRAFSQDGGVTWSTLENDLALKTVSCNGSLIAVDHPKGKDGAILLCSVPVGPGRTHGTVYVSFDGGKTWPHKKLVVEEVFAYSSLMQMPDGYIGLFFEANGHKNIKVARFSLDWLLSDNKTKRPNVLLIVSEDNGPELGCYGDPYVRTPVLDKMAENGVRFENAFVPYSVCSPSRACFLTGLHPHQNGQIGLATHKYQMYEAFPNIPSILKKAGYRTGLIGKLHVNPESAFPYDFREIRSANFGKGQRDMKKYAESASKFFNASDDPFFLSINYPDAHFPLHRQDHGLPEKPLEGEDVKPLPWVGADSERLRKFTADYYNCMSRLDTGVGMLLEKLHQAGKLDNTLIIYFGDHGAQFSRGKTSVYEAGLRIPLIVSWPGHMKEGTVATELTSTLDVLPTILEAAGLGVPDNLTGRPLQSLMNGQKTPWRKYIIAQTNGSSPRLYFQQHSIRDERYKLIISPVRNRPNLCAKAYMDRFNAHFAAGISSEDIAASSKNIQEVYDLYLNPPLHELYDLESDPYEFENLAEDTKYQAIKERLISEFKKWQKETEDPLADPKKLQKLTEEHDFLKNYNYRGDKQFKWKYLDYFFD